MFFSVNEPIKIGGKPFRTCICYEVTSALELTIEKLEREGKVTVYPERVFFCNGKIVVSKEETKPMTVGKKKAKKEKTVPVKDVKELAEEAEILSPEEIADNVEDF